MVVQCPTCQSRFRIADEKVTDRGVRVRCTSCKNVFQVRKAGAGGDPSSAPGPGNTMDLSALGAATIAKAGSGSKPAAPRPGTGPVKPSTGPVKPSTGPVKPATGPVKAAARPATGPVKPSTGPVKPSTGPVKPSTGPVKPSTGPVRTAAPAENGARRLDVDDLFGMAELTGDSPLSSSLDPEAPPETPLKAPDTAPPSGSKEIDLELDLEMAPPAKAAPAPAESPLPSLEPPAPAPAPSASAELPPKPAAQIPLDDSFAMAAPPPENKAAPASGLELDQKATRAPEPAAPKTDPGRRPVTKPQAAKAKEPEIAPAKAVFSSAVTGLLGAALAIIVVITSALSDEGGAAWLGFGPARDVIATGVVSGLYDTQGGKPVFYVRGRVQNRSGKVRGPVRVTAELVGDDDAQLKAETIAGAEPTAEDVWSLRSPADADKLARTLQSERVTRKLPPGGSLPFFAVIPDPPADLQGRRLQIKVETVEAWTPRAANAAREK